MSRPLAGSTPEKPRQPQAQRRAIALAKISVAGLEILAESGYQAMTFSNVAARAGVTRGNILHYFSQKTDLALFVLEEGLNALRRELREKVLEWQPDDPDLDGRILDDIYFGGTIFQAFLALQVHARTDPEMNDRLGRFAADTIDSVGRIAAEGWGTELTRLDEWQDFMELVQSVIQGVAIADPVGDTGSQRGRSWPAARRLLLIALADLRAGRPLSRT